MVTRNSYSTEAEDGGLFGTDPLTNQTTADTAQTQPADWLTGLYQDVFNRAPDEGGYDFWMGASQQGWTPEMIREQFLASPEYQALNAPKTAPTATAPTSTTPSATDLEAILHPTYTTGGGGWDDPLVTHVTQSWDPVIIGQNGWEGGDVKYFDPVLGGSETAAKIAKVLGFDAPATVTAGVGSESYDAPNYDIARWLQSQGYQVETSPLAKDESGQLGNYVYAKDASGKIIPETAQFIKYEAPGLIDRALEAAAVMGFNALTGGAGNFILGARAADQGDILGGLSAMAGVGGLDTVSSALSFANAVEKGDWLGAVTAGMNLSGTQTLGGLDAKDFTAANNIIKGIENNDVGSLLSGANRFINSPDLSVAGPAATVAQALAKGDIGRAISAGKQLNTALQSYSAANSGDVTQRAIYALEASTAASGAEDTLTGAVGVDILNDPSVTIGSVNFVGQDDGGTMTVADFGSKSNTAQTRSSFKEGVNIDSMGNMFFGFKDDTGAMSFTPIQQKGDVFVYDLGDKKARSFTLDDLSSVASRVKLNPEQQSEQDRIFMDLYRKTQSAPPPIDPSKVVDVETRVVPETTNSPAARESVQTNLRNIARYGGSDDVNTYAALIFGIPGVDTVKGTGWFANPVGAAQFASEMVDLMKDPTLTAEERSFFTDQLRDAAMNPDLAAKVPGLAAYNPYITDEASRDLDVLNPKTSGTSTAGAGRGSVNPPLVTPAPAEVPYWKQAPNIGALESLVGAMRDAGYTADETGGYTTEDAVDWVDPVAVGAANERVLTELEDYFGENLSPLEGVDLIDLPDLLDTPDFDPNTPIAVDDEGNTITWQDVVNITAGETITPSADKPQDIAADATVEKPAVKDQDLADVLDQTTVPPSDVVVPEAISPDISPSGVLSPTAPQPGVLTPEAKPAETITPTTVPPPDISPPDVLPPEDLLPPDVVTPEDVLPPEVVKPAEVVKPTEVVTPTAPTTPSVVEPPVEPPVVEPPVVEPPTKEVAPPPEVPPPLPSLEPEPSETPPEPPVKPTEPPKPVTPTKPAKPTTPTQSYFPQVQQAAAAVPMAPALANVFYAGTLTPGERKSAASVTDFQGAKEKLEKALGSKLVVDEGESDENVEKAQQSEQLKQILAAINGQGDFSDIDELMQYVMRG